MMERPFTNGSERASLSNMNLALREWRFSLTMEIKNDRTT